MKPKKNKNIHNGRLQKGTVNKPNLKTSSLDKMPVEDIKKLVFELQNHCSDLEEQNRELNNRKELSEGLINSNIDGIIAFDSDYRYTIWNQGMERMSGVSAGETLGKCAFEIFPFLKKTGEDKYFRDVLAGKTLVAYDRPYLIPQTGKQGFFEAYYYPMRNEAGKVVGGIGTIHDVTDRKRIEEILKKQTCILALSSDVGIALTMRSPLRKMLQQCTEAMVKHLDIAFARIWILNEEEKMLKLKASAGMYTHIDGNHSQVPVGKLKIGIIAREQKPLLTNSLIDDPRVSDKEWVKREGMTAFAGYPLIAKGKLVGVTAMFSRNPFTDDILKTLASVAVEIALVIDKKIADKNLRLSKDMLSHAQQVAHLGSWEIDLEENKTICSDEFYRILGLEPQQSTIDYAKLLDYVHPDDRDFIKESINTAIKESKSGSIDYRIVLPNGAERTIHDEWEFMSEDTEKSIKMFGTIQDITERKKREEEQVKAQKIESLGTLAGGIAHDFNNILTIIYGNISLAKLHVKPYEKIYKYLSDLEGAFVRAKDLADQLLTFSKGGGPVKKTIQISELIKDSTAFALSGSNVKYEMNIEEGLWHVKVDRGQMDQVINNLILNADQSMPEGGKIKIKAFNIVIEANDSLPVKPGKYIKIIIEDQGIGITKEHLQNIFDPYFTTKDEHSGLGLAITYSIIKKHDGYINLESENGTGTTFQIYLPVSEKGITMKDAPVKTSAKDTSGGPFEGKGKILLMDDEEILRYTIGQMLSILQYEVETAKDGIETIELYNNAKEKGAPFDVVIMDLTIPGGMGGKETIKTLLKIDPNVKAIVSSGYSNSRTMANYEDYGFSAVLPKPYNINELSETLRKVLQKTEICHH